MRKIFFLITFTLSNIILFSQGVDTLTHISTLFTVDTSFALKYYDTEIDGRELIATIHNNNIYFCREKAFQIDAIEEKIRVFSVNLLTKEQSFFDLDFPAPIEKKYTHPSNYWVRGLTLTDDKMVIFAEHKILIYDKIDENQFIFNQLIYHQNAVNGYFWNDVLFVFQRDHNKGLILYKYNSNFSKKKKIKDIVFEAPFVWQFTPNRYFSIEEDCFYILETVKPMFKKYDLEGNYLSSISFTARYPWQTIPDSTIASAMRHSYGVERIYYALQHNRQNSYPSILFPLSNRDFIIGTHQYDFEKERDYFGLIFHESKNDEQEGVSKSYRFFLNDNDTLSKNLFPFYYINIQSCLMIPWRNSIVQISKEADVQMQNISLADYNIEKENYFKLHDPIITMRFLKLKKSIPPFQMLDSFYVKNFDNELLQFNQIAEKKWIVLLRPPIYCSGCIKAILHYFDSLTIDTSSVNIGIIIENEDNFLQRRETSKEIQKDFLRSYTPCYVTNVMKNSIYNSCLPYQENPLVILIDYNKKDLQLFGEEDIFTSDILKLEFKNHFLKMIELFLKE